MTDILAARNVVLGASADSQQAVFALIAERAAVLGITTDPSAVAAGLRNRESQGTTGLMDGIAIPHTKSPAITDPALVIVKLNAGVDWDSLDSRPIRLAIALLIPEGEAGTTHLKLLSRVAKTLMKADVRAGLLEAESAEAIVALFGEHVLTDA
jgi:PTS system fructose-specific IIA component